MLTIDFIDKLTANNDIMLSCKDAFEVIQDKYNICKLAIQDKKKTHIIIDKNEEAFDNYIYKGKKITLTYNKQNEPSWNELDRDELLIYSKIFEIQYEKHLSDVKALEAGYTQIVTELPNSAGFIRLIAMRKFEDLKDYTSFSFNLKNFGIINKAFGQQQGDKAIIDYANHLRDFIDKDEIISHFGGDNFAALIKNDRAQDFIEYANNVEVFLHNGNKDVELLLTAVIGAYELKNGIKELGDVINLPNLAMQYAKSQKIKFTYLNESLRNSLAAARQVEQIFDDELIANHFIPYYQPKVDIRTGKIIGCEALARWVNKDDVIPPSMFVPTLEATGKIYKLDLYVLEYVCQDIKYCHDNGYKTVPVSCNISRKDLLIEDFDRIVLNIINQYGIKPNEIVIEVTETTTIDEQELMLKFIETMGKNGISTSIDDFGTGYSSLSTLRDLKVKEIKIDRSFINRTNLLVSDEIIISSIIEMARKLNIDVICEGVENEFQAAFLERLGCYNAQGFLFDKPLSKYEFKKRLDKGNYII